MPQNDGLYYVICPVNMLNRRQHSVGHIANFSPVICSSTPETGSWRARLTFRFENKSFLILSSAHALISVILAGKHDSRRHLSNGAPLPHRFLFRPRFSFRAVESLTYEPEKKKRTKKTPATQPMIVREDLTSFRKDNSANFSDTVGVKEARRTRNKIDLTFCCKYEHYFQLKRIWRGL